MAFRKSLESSLLLRLQEISARVDAPTVISRSLAPERKNPFSIGRYLRNACLQRLPTRLTGPPRFIGVPARTPTPAAPTPGVSTTAAATGAPGATTTAASGRTTHPLGTPTVLQ